MPNITKLFELIANNFYDSQYTIISKNTCVYVCFGIPEALNQNTMKTMTKAPNIETALYCAVSAWIKSHDNKGFSIICNNCNSPIPPLQISEYLDCENYICSCGNSISTTEVKDPVEKALQQIEKIINKEV